MRKNLGYIVLANSGEGYYAACDIGKKNPTFWFGTHITVFPTRRAAAQCLRRTKAWLVEVDYDWPCIHHSTIHAVRAL